MTKKASIAAIIQFNLVAVVHLLSQKKTALCSPPNNLCTLDKTSAIDDTHMLPTPKMYGDPLSKEVANHATTSPTKPKMTGNPPSPPPNEEAKNAPSNSSKMITSGLVQLVPEDTLDFTFNAEHMDANVFLYEVPSLKFWSLSAKAQAELVALGNLHEDRMEYLEEILVVPQSLTNTCITVCDNGKLPHYQVSCQELKTFQEEKNHHSIRFRQATSFTNHVKIFESPCLREQLPWREWIEFLHTHGEKPSDDDARQQALHVDLGFTSNQSTARTGKASSADGVSTPLMKPSTELLREDYDCTEGIRKVNKFLDRMISEGIVTDKLFALPVQRLKEFANKLPGKGRAEALRLNISYHKSRTGAHQDSQNDPVYPHFVSFSQIFFDDISGVWVRVSLILYTRQSVGSYYARRQDIGKVVQKLVDFYKSSPEYRRTPRVHPPANKRRFSARHFGIKCYGRPCGLDPGTYLGSSVHALACLKLKFNLTLPEAISGLRAFTYMGFSPFFFVNACHLILGMGEKQPPETGFRFGLFILQLMMDLRKVHDDKGVPGFRYGASGNIPVGEQLPNAEEWDEKCRKMMTEHLLAFKVPEPTNDNDAQKLYDRIEGRVVKTLDYCGSLGSLHAIAFASIFGFLPFWMLSYVRVNAQGRPQKAIAKQFGFHSNKDIFSNIRASTCYSFNHNVFIHNKVKVSRRFGENLECKLYRCNYSEAAEGDRRFHDLQCDNQFDVQIMFAGRINLYYDGERVTLKDSLFKEWFYSSYFRTPSEIIDRDASVNFPHYFQWRDQKEREDYRCRSPSWKRTLPERCFQPIEIYPKHHLKLVSKAYRSYMQATKDMPNTLGVYRSPPHHQETAVVDDMVDETATSVCNKSRQQSKRMRLG